jgi:hypothetical protein
MLQLILTLAFIGLIVYLIETFIPMPQVFKVIIYAIVAICLILWLMHVFGVSDIPLPRVH